MSPDLFKRKKVNSTVSREALAERGRALDTALQIGSGKLPDALVATAREVDAKVTERTAIVGGRTVVAFAGATGSGKSSLFNALVGEPVSRIGARRPTTSQAAAAVWGEDPAGPLLDWLKVGARHQVPATSRSATELDGLVLLDLPDFDSRVAAHRAEADRVIGLADVFVWVTDPQKYADAIMHDDYIRRMASHTAVTLVVLNQVDRLSAAAVQECLADLKRLIAQDGLSDVRVLTTSAVRGQGLPELVEAVGNVVRGRNAAEQRLAADLRTVAGQLRQHVADSEADPARAVGAELTDALARAAAVPVVRQAVERDYVRGATARGGWPFTRWASKLRPAPLSRLGLDKVASSLNRSEARVALGKSSLPHPSPAALAAVDLATRKVGEEASTGLPAPWADAVHDAAQPAGPDLRDALDQAVLGTPLRERNPWWWAVVSGLQWLFAAAVVAGLVWLLVLAGLGFAQIHAEAPTWGFLPAPLSLLVIGIVGGLLVAGLTHAIAGKAAKARGRAVEKRLRAAVGEVGVERVITPVRAVLSEHRQTREALDQAIS
ncbi:GTPase [Calidifontibacter terrae]